MNKCVLRPFQDFRDGGSGFLRGTVGWIVCLALTLLVPTELHAQPFWWDHTSGPSLSLELARPSYPGRRYDFTSPWPLTGGVLVGFRYPLADRLLLITELPLAHVSGRTNECVDATCLRFAHGTILGNPYLGAEIGPLRGIAVLRLGMRLPLQKASYRRTRDYYDNVAARIGNNSERVDRLEAFLPEVTSGIADVLMGVNVVQPLRLRALAGLSLLYHPDAYGYTHYLEKYQLHLRLGAEALWIINRTRLGVGFLTRDRLTGVDAFLDPEERRVWEASAKARYRFGNWNAGLSLRLWHHRDHEFDRDPREQESYWDWRVLTLMIERALWRDTGP